MAGAGIEIRLDEQYEEILRALSLAAMPNLKKIADFAGGELDFITKGAFTKQRDPSTGARWKPPKGRRPDGTAFPILDYGGQLKRSLAGNWEAFPDGSVIYGSNMVYARIHQMGGKAGRGGRSLIPARPYMGVPQDFDRRILNDPKVLEWLGMAGGGQ